MLIELLSKSSNIEEGKLLSLASTASRRYKIYTIPKRDGSPRTIEHPSRELKAIQRWLIRALFARFPIHEAATAYKKGSGIRMNAERHRLTNFTNRYDFKDFFPSFTQERILDYIVRQSRNLGIDLTDRDLKFIGDIVCRNGRLTIGAPSSPVITNVMMFEFDQRMHDACKARDLVYTRYADDIFVSSYDPGQLDNIGKLIANCKRGIPFIKLRLNHAKTTHLSRKFRRAITGVIITPQRTLSIGRERKREVKALIHLWSKGELDPEKVYYLKGLFAFAIDIEPLFEERLIMKYGGPLIAKLRGIDWHPF